MGGGTELDRSALPQAEVTFSLPVAFPLPRGNGDGGKLGYRAWNRLFCLRKRVKKSASFFGSNHDFSFRCAIQSTKASGDLLRLATATE